jgi:SAM-dependent methyltransferase
MSSLTGQMKGGEKLDDFLDASKMWNDIGSDYEEYWNSISQEELSNKEINFIKNYLPKEPIAILDYGVGIGRILDVLLQNSQDGSKVYGYDISSEMIKHCNNRFGRTNKLAELKVIENVEEIKGKNFFDFISAIRVLKYNHNWEDILQSLFWSLKKGGIIIFTFPNKNSVTAMSNPSSILVKRSVGEMEIILDKYDMRLIDVEGFSRLPEFFYRMRSKFSANSLMLMENFLDSILGKKLFERELFYVAMK